jgi:SNF family Na+-dependent transporter
VRATLQCRGEMIIANAIVCLTFFWLFIIAAVSSARRIESTPIRVP